MAIAITTMMAKAINTPKPLKRGSCQNDGLGGVTLFFAMESIKMATTSVDQVTGYGETVAYKAPCRLATTANIALSGLQTIDGSLTVTDDRVLVKNQTDARENGIYIASTGLWQRARDMDSNRDLTKGTRLSVTDGTVNGGSTFQVTTENPLVVGTSDMVFAVAMGGLPPAIRDYIDVPPYVFDSTTLAALDPTQDLVAVFDGSIWNAVAYSGVSTLVAADTVGGMYVRSTTNTAYAWVRQSDTIALEYFCTAVYPADATAGLAAAFAVFKILQRTVTARAMYKSTARISLTNTFLDIRGIGEQQAGIVFTNSGGIKVDNSAYNTLYRPISIEKFSLIPTTLGLYNGLEVLGAVAAFENQVMCDRLDTNPFLYGGTGYWANCVSMDSNVEEATFTNCVMLVQAGHANPAYGITTNGGNLVVVDGGVYDGFTAAFNVTDTGSFIVKPGTFIFSCDNIGIRQGIESHTVMTGCHAYSNSGWVISAGNHYFFADNFFIPKSASFIGFDISSSFGQIHNNQIIDATGVGGAIGVKVRTGAATTLIQGNIWYNLTNGVVVDAGATDTKVYDNAVTGSMTAASGLSDAGTGTQFRVASSTGFSYNLPLLPWADDGAALGSTAKEWSDLFLATGGVINWGAGNVTITHSAGTLALAGNFTATGVVLGHNVSVSGATVAANGIYLPSAGKLGFATGSSFKMQMTATDLSPAANDGLALGTTALQWSDAFLASGGVINWANGDATLTHGTGKRVSLAGNFGRGAPVVKTADFTVADTENWLISNKGAATCTVTLPAAASYTGREISILNYQAFTVVSASANVIPMAAGSAGTAILAATAGKWATLVSDGANWRIMAGN